MQPDSQRHLEKATGAEICKRWTAFVEKRSSKQIFFFETGWMRLMPEASDYSILKVHPSNQSSRPPLFSERIGSQHRRESSLFLRLGNSAKESRASTWPFQDYHYYKVRWKWQSYSNNFECVWGRLCSGKQAAFQLFLLLHFSFHYSNVWNLE